jgi:large subunit ribosomal protein L18e
MISKTKTKQKQRKKTNPNLVSTIGKANKEKNWVKIAHLVSVPRRKLSSVNLDQLDKESKEGDTLLVPGKVLGQGDVSKKLRIVALSFSQTARDKLKSKKCEIVSVDEEIKVNPQARGIKIVK